MQDGASLLTAGRRPLRAHGVGAAVLGNALEFYDFGVYAAYAVMIGHAFFPFSSGFFSLLASVATFGVGFVSRPLGGFLLGAYADRRGRKPAMTLTIGLMALGTAMIGLLPTYAAIGPLAPLLLLAMRLMQGAAIGGEAPGGWVFVAEHVAAERTGLAVGLLTGGLTGGILLGSLALALSP